MPKAEITKARRTKRQRELQMLAKQHDLMEMSVSIGSCKRCPVSDVCQYVDEEDTCTAAEVVKTAFITEALSSPWLKKEDFFALRNLAALQASIYLSELYFKKYGSVETKKGGLVFSEMQKSYTRMISQLQDGLDKFGLTPYGRKKMEEKISGGESDTKRVEHYIMHKYGGGVEVEEEVPKGEPDPEATVAPTRPGLPGLPSSFGPDASKSQETK